MQKPVPPRLDLLLCAPRFKLFYVANSLARIIYQDKVNQEALAENVHFIPVGFDFSRLIQPIAAPHGEGLPADRVIILYSAGESDDDRVEEYLNSIVDEIETTFTEVLRREVERIALDIDIFDYSEVYEFAYFSIMEELVNGNQVWINISSMPRTVAFAFATAAESIIIEDPDQRERITTYYASPEKYMVLDMIEELKNELQFLSSLQEESDSKELQNRKESISEIVSSVSKGVTDGVKELNGKLYSEIPAPPSGNLRDIEKRILHFLEEFGEPVKSTTQLSKDVANYYDVTFSDSFNSKVQYNVKQLKTKGYLEIEAVGNSNRVSLTKMGELWTRTHSLPVD